MQKRDKGMPEQNRSPSEIAFVLRHAKRKSGPEVLREMARHDSDAAPTPKPRPAEAATHRRKTLF